MIPQRTISLQTLKILEGSSESWDSRNTTLAVHEGDQKRKEEYWKYCLDWSCKWFWWERFDFWDHSLLLLRLHGWVGLHFTWMNTNAFGHKDFKLNPVNGAFKSKDETCYWNEWEYCWNRTCWIWKNQKIFSIKYMALIACAQNMGNTHDEFDLLVQKGSVQGI